MRNIYQKYQNCIEKLCFPVILMLYPLLTVDQGLDVADSTYSLANFQYFTSMDGTWMVATFLSNVTGWLLMHLPFGGTLLGMKCYTMLVQSAIALMVYFGLKKRIPAPLLFLGEMIALGLCWCPSTILYNYLTYLLMTAAVLFLYRGLTADTRQPVSVAGNASQQYEKTAAREEKTVWKQAGAERQRRCFVAAGVCLGLNVAVRMPNVVQAAFILAVWYGIVVTEGKLYQSTLWCFLGYLFGFSLPFAVICMRYGTNAYPDMVKTMFAMTEKAVDYKPTSMLTGMFGDYGKGLYWFAFAGICMAAGWLAYTMAGRRNTNKIAYVIITAAYAMLFVVLLRFYWGRGMFTFRYYEHDYRSMYYPTVLFLLVTIYLCMYCLIAKKSRREQKIFAALLLVQIFITPLGSNNALSPIINNLFLAAPFTLWIVWDMCAARRVADAEKATARLGGQTVVWALPFTMLVLFVLVQSVGFHANFVFQDGIWGEPRDRKVQVPKKAAGIYTNQQNGVLLEELALFIEEEGLSGREAITYGELPGLHYLLDMPPALSTAWPDLDSYRMAEYRRDMAALGGTLPVIILSTPVAAYLSDDGEAISWFDVDIEAMAADEKLQILSEWLNGHGYTEQFGNARYVVYAPQVR